MRHPPRGGKENRGMTREERLRLLEDQPGETISPMIASLILGGDPYANNLVAKEGILTLTYVWRGVIYAYS